VLTVLVAGWVATKLTRTALRPITDLVTVLGKLDPAEPHPLCDENVRTREARLIAKSVDGYQSRIASLLEREKSLTDDISHQLRTPTSVIATAAELLLDDPEIAGLNRQRVFRVSRAARRMEDIVEAILFLGRGNATVPAVKVDLRAVVSEAVDDYRPVAQAKGIELHAEVTDEQWLTAPAGLPAIIVQNLLENAIQFTASGTVRMILEPGRLVVEDTGIGLAGVDKDSIFERGYRGDTSHGSGLGLDLIWRICDRLGWKVSAHERPGGGTQFVVLWQSGAP
jgi:signal transduction histidine kinase